MLAIYSKYDLVISHLKTSYTLEKPKSKTDCHDNNSFIGKLTIFMSEAVNQGEETR